MMEKYIVYAKADEKGRVIALSSSAFLQDTTGWTAIDEGYGDKYHHAQGNYLEKAINEVVPLFKLVEGKIEARSEEELAEDIKAIPVFKSLEERFEELLSIVNGLVKMFGGGSAK